MKMTLCKTILLAGALILGMANSCTRGTKETNDWPQYLGPYRNSTSDQKGILRSWPENGPEVLWSVDVGIGFGGPAVRDGKVYLLDRNGETGDIMRCFDLVSGSELWRFEYSAPGSVMFPGSRSVPTVDGNHVYSCSQNGDLYCIDINTHKPVWNKNLMTDFGGTQRPVWAITQCPLIYGDLLIVAYTRDFYDGVVAFDKLTGDIVWQTPILGNETYASPSIVKIAGEDHVAMVFSSTNPVAHRDLPRTMGKIAGIRPLTGEILWEYNDWENHIQVPSALDAGEDRVIVVGGYELGTVMIKVEKTADGGYSVKELFKHNEFGDHTKPPILHNGYFYAQFSTNSKRDGLVCMNMEGEIMWKTMRSPLFDKGSMILVDGLILATDGRQTLYLIEPDPTGFKPLASADVLKEGVPGSGEESIETRFGGGTRNWAPLALANGRLLIRDQNRLMCVKVAN